MEFKEDYWIHSKLVIQKTLPWVLLRLGIMWITRIEISDRFDIFFTTAVWNQSLWTLITDFSVIKSKHKLQIKSNAKLKTVLTWYRLKSVEEQKGMVTGGEINRRFHEKIALEMRLGK